MSSEPKDIVPVAGAPLVTLEPDTPSILSTLLGAVAQGRTPEELRAIGDLIDQAEKRCAKQEFYAALARFQAACPSIPRSKKADFATRSGRMAYDYAELDVILAFIRPHLVAQGLSCGWPKSDTTEKGTVHVVCCVRHSGGHSELTESAEFPIDKSEKSPLSGEQRVSRTETTAKRRSLAQALGFSLCPDTDGNEPHSPAETITEEQVRHIDGLLIELHDYDKDDHTRGRFLAAFGVEKMAELPAGRYGAAVDALANKLAKAKERAEGT